MLTYKCTCCGRSMSVEEDQQIGKCSVCGSLFILPNYFAEKQNIYLLASEALIARNFDMALTYYSRILKVDAKETAAHWGYLLSKYGVEVSAEASTYQNIIFHRLEQSSFTADPSYEKMITYCPREALYYYQGLSRHIEEQQKKLLKISHEAGVFDIYINCVASPGTPDYLLANQTGQALHDAGYRVFLPCTMLPDVPEEDKNLYEMAVAEKASTMIVICTDSTKHDNARYRASWKRFLAYRRQDAGRKMLSVFQNIDPSQLPMELQPLQSIDAGVSSFQDTVLTKINEMFGRKNQSSSLTREILQLLNDANLQLAHNRFSDAADLFHKVLRLDAEEAAAHWGLVCAATKNLTVPSFSAEVDRDYQRALQFAQSAPKERFRQAMCDLMREPAWKNLMKLTAELTKTQIADRSDVAEAIRLVYQYLPKEDPRLAKIEAYHAAAKAHREAAAIHKAYEQRDTAVQPLFAEQSKKEDAYSSCNVPDTGWSKSLRSIATIVMVSLFLLLGGITLFTYGLGNAGSGLSIVALLIYAVADITFAVTMFTMLRQLVDDYNPIEDTLYFVAAGIPLLMVLVPLFTIRKHSIPVFLISIAVVILVWIVLRFFAFMSAQRFRSAVREQYRAAKQIDAVNLQIHQAYQQQMKEHFSKYGMPDEPIPEYTVKNSNGFHYSTAKTRAGNPTFYLLFSAVILAAAVAVTTIVNNQLYTSAWNNIVSVAAGPLHVVGLKEDGTVVARGSNTNHMCDVSEWKNVAAIDVGQTFTIGLKEDGTVYAAGDEDIVKGVENWKNIVQISASDNHVLALKKDGTCVAVATHEMPSTDVGQFFNVAVIHTISASDGSLSLVALEDGSVRATQYEGWESIQNFINEDTGSGEGQLNVNRFYGDFGAVVMATKDGRYQGIGSNNNQQLSTIENWDKSQLKEIYVCDFAIGLNKDGTAQYAGKDSSAAAQVKVWKDIVDLHGERNHVLALRKDGTVTTAGSNDDNQCNVADWEDVESIYASVWTSYGITSDQKVLAAGRDYYGSTYLTPKNPIEIVQFWINSID